MATIVGISGARRNACAATCAGGTIVGACELERLTRVHRVPLRRGRLPEEAVDVVLESAGRKRADVDAYVVAEHEIELPPSVPTFRVDHDRAHAAAAFLPSPFQTAAILVCDEHSPRPLTVWTGDGSNITDRGWEWRGPAFASLYSTCADLLGFDAGQEHRLEALARVGAGDVGRFDELWRYDKAGLELRPGWESCLREWATTDSSGSTHRVADVASAAQRHLGTLLLQLVQDVRESLGARHLCLGGGLFYNTYFNTLIRRSGGFEGVFVPINPGNAGLAVGGSLAFSSRQSGSRAAVSPFLGPSYEPETIKAILDNCKLSHEFMTEQGVLDVTVDALRRGRLVAWFQSRMEWGPRALGHRSILADPRSPYVLDNLNVFLKKRDRHRAYGLSVLAEDLERYFVGPPESPFMEYEYTLRDPELFRAVIPDGAVALRVQSIGSAPNLFRQLHRAYAEATGVGVLVNTSFNGFLEPIVCTPRDAVRVFYGTGLDLLVIDRFVLRK